MIGYTDLPSRLPTQSSTLYSNNVTKFLLSLGDGKFALNLDDEVVRGSLVIHRGKILEPVPLAPPPSPPVPPPVEEKVESVAITPWQKTTREVATVTAGMGSVIALGKLTGTAFMSNFFTFGLAGLVGYRVVWGVAPALHSPLMSVTNAISGKIDHVLFREYVLNSMIGQAWLGSVVSLSWAADISQEQSLRLWALYPSYWPA